jgi:hypothetical protein
MRAASTAKLSCKGSQCPAGKKSSQRPRRHNAHIFVVGCQYARSQDLRRFPQIPERAPLVVCDGPGHNALSRSSGPNGGQVLIERAVNVPRYPLASTELKFGNHQERQFRSHPQKVFQHRAI